MKVLIADDHAVVRSGLAQALQHLGDQVTVLEASDFPQALATLDEHPDLMLVLVDLNMPGMESFAAIGALAAKAASVPVVVLSASESPYDMQRALDAGAMGYIPKTESMAVMLGALRLTLAGGVYVPPALHRAGADVRKPVATSSLRHELTPRQQEVLRRVIDGKSNKEIARELNLSEATVKAHIAAVFRTLNVTNRVQAARAAEELGLNATRSS